MQGGIRSIESLEKWFRAVGKPCFTLSYLGQANQVIARNTTVEDMGEAWEMLRMHVLAQAEYGRAQMHVIVYANDKGGPNNPSGRTNIDLLSQHHPAHFAGIAGMPTGNAVPEDKIAGILAEAREKWEMEKRLDDLEAQLNAPPDDLFEKTATLIERIGTTPIGSILLAKLMGGAPVLPPAPITGTPKADNDPSPDDAEDFDDNIDRTAQILGVSDAKLAATLRRFAETNPEVAKQLFQQA